MTERFEFDVIQLKSEVDERDRRCFRWQSRRGGCHDVDHDGLQGMLNRLGAQGWSVVSHAVDAAFGSTLVLQRALPEIAAATVEPRATHAKRAEIPASPVIVSAPVDLNPLIDEIRALRTELAQQPAPRVTVQPASVHVVSPTVNFAEVRPHLEAILGALKQIEAGQPVAARVVERLIEEALRPPQPAPKMEPKFASRRSWLFNWSWVTGR